MQAGPLALDLTPPTENTAPCPVQGSCPSPGGLQVSSGPQYLTCYWRKTLNVLAGAKHRMPCVRTLGAGQAGDIQPRWLPQGPPGCITHWGLGQMGWKDHASGSCVCSWLLGSVFHVPEPPKGTLPSQSSERPERQAEAPRGGRGSGGRGLSWVEGSGLEVRCPVLASRIRHTHPPGQTPTGLSGVGQGALFSAGESDPEGRNREPETLNPTCSVPCVKLSRLGAGERLAGAGERAAVLPPESAKPNGCFPRSYVC